MFSLNRGDEYLPSTLPSANGTLFWSATRGIAERQLFIKVRPAHVYSFPPYIFGQVSNTADTAQNITFQLPFDKVSSAGTVQLLTGAANDSNTPDAPKTIVPTDQFIKTGKSFGWTAPGYSVAVLTVGIQ